MVSKSVVASSSIYQKGSQFGGLFVSLSVTIGREDQREPLHLEGNVFDFFQEVDIRLVRYPGPLHRLSQIIRLSELLGFPEIIPLEKSNEFIWILSIAEEPTAPGTASLASGSMLVKQRLPLVVVFDFMPDKYVWHGAFISFLCLATEGKTA
jgi:hypothetical protein